MKKGFGLLAFALLMFTGMYAQTIWKADPAHTEARFTVKHLGISFVGGSFTKAAGVVETSTPKDFSNANINFVLEANSIDTRVEARNNHLKSDDFFNVEKYPELKLKSVSFKKVSGNKYKLIADLTIRDITRRVVFTATQNGGIITDPWGKTRAGFTATTTIDRHQFGLKYNDKLPSGIEAVASLVSIVINTELVKS